MKSILRFIVLGAAVLSLGGCVSSILAGKSGTRFQASVQDVYDASLATLDAEKMPVLSKSISTGMANITSQYPSGTRLAIAIKEVSPKYTQADIAVQALGDDYRAYDLMKKIEARVMNK